MNHATNNATPAELELARLAADLYGRPESDIPALVAFERHRIEQVKIPGMPGLSGAIPNFIAGFNAARAVIAATVPAELCAPFIELGKEWMPEAAAALDIALAKFPPEGRKFELVATESAPSTDLIAIGAKMANVMFNLAQQEGCQLTNEYCTGMDQLRKQWDAARAPARPPVDHLTNSDPLPHEPGAATDLNLDKRGPQ